MRLLLALAFFIASSAYAGFSDWLSDRKSGEGEFFFRVGSTLNDMQKSEHFQRCKLNDSNDAQRVKVYVCEGVKTYITYLVLSTFEDRLVSITAYFKKSKEAQEVLDGLKDKFGPPIHEVPYKAQGLDDINDLGDSWKTARIVNWKTSNTFAYLLGVPFFCTESQNSGQPCGISAKRFYVRDEALSAAMLKHVQGLNGEKAKATREKLGF